VAAGGWSALAVFVCSALSYVFTANGLYVANPELQTFLLPGLAGGLLSGSPVVAALGTSTSVFLCALVAPPWFVDPATGGVPGWAAVLALAGGVLAGSVAFAGQNWRQTTHVTVFGVGMLLLLANFWHSTVTVSSTLPRGPLPPLFEYLQRAPIPMAYNDDNGIYLRTYYLMDDGWGYYRAFKEGYLGALEGHPGGPPGVFGYRQPTLFMLWRILPGDARAIPYALAVLVSAGTLFFALAVRRLATPAAVLVSAAGILSYMLWFTTSPMVLFTEPWAVPFALASVAAVAAHYQLNRSLGWLWAAAGLALLSAGIREHFAILIVAGLVASWWGEPSEERSRRSLLAPWVAAGLAFAAFYAVHVASIPAAEVALTGGTVNLWLKGGIDHVVAVLRYATPYLALRYTTSLVAAALGAAGAIWLTMKGARMLGLYLGVSTLIPPALYLVVGGGIQITQGEPFAPWGPTVVPILYSALAFFACILPGAGCPAGQPRGSSP